MAISVRLSVNSNSAHKIIKSSSKGSEKKQNLVVIYFHWYTVVRLPNLGINDILSIRGKVLQCYMWSLSWIRKDIPAVYKKH